MYTPTLIIIVKASKNVASKVMGLTSLEYLIFSWVRIWMKERVVRRRAEIINGRMYW